MQVATENENNEEEVVEIQKKEQAKPESIRDKLNKLDGKKKSAIILTLLGPDVAGEVLKYLEEMFVEQLSVEVARLDVVKPQARDNVIGEVHKLLLAQDYMSSGGMVQAKRVLESAFGEEKAEAIMKRISAAMESVPFDFLRRADPHQLFTFIQDEHPQTIALILAYLPPNQSAQMLVKLPTELRVEVAERVAMMEQTPPDVLRKIEQVLEKKVANMMNQEMKQAGGPESLVEMLNRADRTTEKMILEALESSNPELAAEVKGMMFVFEDLVLLDDKSIQVLLKDVDPKDLAVALKTAKEEVSSKIFKNMSERARGTLQEEMEFLGPVKVKVVEEAQQKIVGVVRTLEERGEITISRGDEDAFV